MSKGHWKHVKGGFVFYGVLYPTKNACMRKLGITGYDRLERLIEAEKQGLPLVIPRRKRGAEMGKRRYFEKKLKQEGFWHGD